MAIIKTFSGVALRIPGAYSALKVRQPGGLPLIESGVVGILGESKKGPPGSDVGVLEFDSSTLQDVVNTYGDGPIVDACRALVNASNDTRVLNGANRILIYKTNNSTQASLDLDTTWGTLTSSNYGTDENLINVTIEEDTAETWELEFGADWTATPSSNLTLRVNGGTLVTLTAASMTSAAASVTEINSKLNTALGTVAVPYASNVANRISIDLMATGTGADRSGMGICLEFIASSEYADIGVVPAQQGIALVAGASGAISLTATNPTRTFTVNRQSDAVTETSADTTGEVGGDIAMKIACYSDACTLTINSTQFILNATGAGASDLTLTLADYATLNDLAEYISTQTGYACEIPDDFNGALSPTVLDRVSAVNIAATTAGILPGHVKADSYAVKNFFDTNISLVTAEETSHLGLPDVMAKTFLAGGTLGSSSTSSFDSGFVAYEAQEVDILIPLVSQDAADDNTEESGYTDSSSTYDIESIHVLARDHCKKMSNVQNKKERACYLGYRGTFEECKTQSKIINSEFCSMLFQDSQVLTVDGELDYRQPHITACLVAGIQAGTEVGEATTYKYVAANGIKHVKKQGVTPSALELYEPDRIGHKNQAIDNGLTPLEAPKSGGIRIVVGNTTYQKDSSFVYNRVSVLEASHYVAKTLRRHLEDTYTGTKAKTGTAQSIYNFVVAEMKQFLDNDIIVGDDDAPLGWKNLNVVVNGNTATVDICIKPVQALDFILINLSLDNIRQQIGG